MTGDISLHALTCFMLKSDQLAHADGLGVDRKACKYRTKKQAPGIPVFPRYPIMKHR